MAAGALVDADAEAEAGLLQAPGEPGGVEHGDAVAVPQAGAEGRRVDLGAQGVLVEEGVPVEAEPGGVRRRPPAARRPGGARWRCRSRRCARSRSRCRSGRRPPRWRRGCGCRALRGAASSSGQRARPLPRPWVREAAQKPPLRPEAAQPISAPSIRTTSRCGSRSLAMQRGPQPAVAAADDQQVAGLVADEGGQRRGAVRVVQPEGGGFGVRECLGGGRGHGSSCHGSQLLLLLLRRCRPAGRPTTHSTATRNIAVPMTLI